VRVSDWRPVNTLPKISDPSSIIERLGGKQLYGDDPIVPIRELIQNSVDAIRARRFVDNRFSVGTDQKYPGKVSIEFKELPETNEVWIVVEDNGVGMSEKTITRSLLDFGASFWSSVAAAQLYPGLPSEKKFRPIGRFGIGFFSVFMYSDIVIVMSREFASATNVWNVLSFNHGVRGRGNLSVEGTPAEISNADASTRIKLRVRRDFMDSLLESADAYEVNDGESTHRNIERMLTTLVCALDVRVELRLFGETLTYLNEPLIYEKNADAVWDVLNISPEREEDTSLLEKQKYLFAPIREGDELYGYCGVSLTPYRSLALIKSVGGMGSQEAYYENSPVAGIAEYDTAAANRIPNKLVAPQHAIDAWGKDQIVRINQLKLTADEQESAWEHLGQLVDDIRPIFIVATSEGPLRLDELVENLRAEGGAILPAMGKSGETTAHLYARFPYVSHEFSLQMSDIKFSRFTVRIGEGTSLFFTVSQGKLKPNIKPGVYKNAWDTILNTLEDRNIPFELSLHSDYNVGTYASLDSPRHNLQNGAKIIGAVLEIRLK